MDTTKVPVLPEIEVTPDFPGRIVSLIEILVDSGAWILVDDVMPGSYRTLLDIDATGRFDAIKLFVTVEFVKNGKEAAVPVRLEKN